MRFQRGSDHRRRRAVSAPIVLLAPVLVTVPPAEGAFPGRNGKIVFTAFYDRGSCGEVLDCVDFRLHLLNPRAGTSERLNGCPKRECDDSEPAWSPDGRWLVFVRDPYGGGDSGVFIVRPGGSDLRPVKAGGAPTWSPDGQRLAFTVRQPARRCCVSYLFTGALDGADRSRLTSTGEADSPAWSSRGRIAFVRKGRRGPRDIWTIGADGSGLQRLTARGGEQPDWSPDGRKLVFTRSYEHRDGSFVDEVAMINGRGGRARRLTYRGGEFPVWSPDGKRIAFSRGSRLLTLSLATGRVQSLLTLQSGAFNGLDWQPRP
jgi:Tol biopolymer transport system component